MADPMYVGAMAQADHGEKVVLGIDVTDVSAAMQKFGWPDYVVFIIMLMVCIAIGIYFAYFSMKKVTKEEYLVGGRNMSVFPVSLSLIASFVSGISLLGIPTEIYVYGIHFLYIFVAIILMGLVVQSVFLPVFHDLKLTSTYEYLERRFDKRIRLVGSLLYSIGLIVWLPVVIYVPALAFNQVTGVNVHFITPAVCFVCIIYTTIGGIRAVVWTDVIQTIIMYGAVLLVIIKGTIDIGGAEVVWDRNVESSRIEGPNVNFDIYSRHTVLSLVIGGFFYWTQAAAINQTMIQRYLSLPSLKKAKRALWIFIIGVIIVNTLSGYAGMLIYATFYKCDPLTTMLAREKDQLLPLLVMEVLGELPGLPGLFVAGIFSAALSSLSTGLNSMAAVVLEDFYKTFINKDISEKKANILMKSTVVFMGIICVALVFVVEKLGAVLQMNISVSAIVLGPSLSLFAMGVLIPWINAKGALIGSLTSLLFMAWMCVNVQVAIASGDLTFPEKEVSTEGCHYTFTPKLSPSLNIKLDPTLNVTDIPHNEIFTLYRLSYLWYTMIGCFVSIIVSLIASFLTKPQDPKDLEKELLAPFIRQFISERNYPNQPRSDDIIYAYEPSKSGNMEKVQTTTENL